MIQIGTPGRSERTVRITEPGRIWSATALAVASSSTSRRMVPTGSCSSVWANLARAPHHFQVVGVTSFSRVVTGPILGAGVAQPAVGDDAGDPLQLHEVAAMDVVDRLSDAVAQIPADLGGVDRIGGEGQGQDLLGEGQAVEGVVPGDGIGIDPRPSPSGSLTYGRPSNACEIAPMRSGSGSFATDWDSSTISGGITPRSTGAAGATGGD